MVTGQSCVQVNQRDSDTIFKETNKHAVPLMVTFRENPMHSIAVLMLIMGALTSVTKLALIHGCYLCT